MRDQLEWGQYAAFLASLPEDQQPEKRPVLLLWLAPAMRAWDQLGSERSHTVTGVAAPLGAMVLKSRPHPIPWSAVHRWCRHQGYSRSEADFWHRCVTILDNEYLSWWAAREAS